VTTAAEVSSQLVSMPSTFMEGKFYRETRGLKSDAPPAS
jgi:hypothetical protein